MMLRSTLPGPTTGDADTLTESLNWLHGDGLVVVRWCGLSRYNAIGRFSSFGQASEAVRLLSHIGVTDTSLSTAALVTGTAIDALIGAHSDDDQLVDRALRMMRSVGGRSCYFESPQTR
jgi:hypothetical protein